MLNKNIVFIILSFIATPLKLNGISIVNLTGAEKIFEYCSKGEALVRIRLEDGEGVSTPRKTNPCIAKTDVVRTASLELSANTAKDETIIFQADGTKRPNVTDITYVNHMERFQLQRGSIFK